MKKFPNVTYCLFTYCMQSYIIYYEVLYAMDIVKVFAQNMRKYRLEKHLSQEALAEKAGLHRTYISAIECGRRSIALENVQRIADALEIETYLLFLNREINTKESLYCDKYK